MQTIVKGRSTIRSQPAKSTERGPLVAVAFGALALSVLLGAASIQRVTAYGDPLTVFQEAAVHEQDNASLQINLGNALLEAGRPEEAIEHYRKSIQIKPLQSNAYNNLGTAYLRTNRTQEAIGQYEQALKMRPNHPDARNNLGAAFQALDRWPEAAQQFEEATRVKPDYLDAWANLAAARAHLQRWDDAVAAGEKALSLARSQGNTSYGERLEQRLATYRDKLATPLASPAAP